MKIHTEDDEPRTGAGIEECRAAHRVAGVFAECLCSGPNTCEYSIPFGYCFLCKHPRLEEILEHTAEVEQLETA